MPHESRSGTQWDDECGTVRPPIGFGSPIPRPDDDEVMLAYRSADPDVDEMVFAVTGEGFNRSDFHSIIEPSSEELVEAEIRLISNDFEDLSHLLADGVVHFPAFGRPSRSRSNLLQIPPPRHVVSRSGLRRR